MCNIWVFRDPVQYGVFLNIQQYSQSLKNFLWIEYLENPDYIMAILAGLSTFFLQKYSIINSNEANTEVMKYVFAIVSFLTSIYVSSALSLYWTTSNVISCIQNIFIKKLRMKFN